MHATKLALGRQLQGAKYTEERMWMKHMEPGFQYRFACAFGEKRSMDFVQESKQEYSFEIKQAGTRESTFDGNGHANGFHGQA